jgi:hypothetical protein
LSRLRCALRNPANVGVPLIVFDRADAFFSSVNSSIPFSLKTGVSRGSTPLLSYSSVRGRNIQPISSHLHRQFWSEIRDGKSQFALHGEGDFGLSRSRCQHHQDGDWQLAHGVCGHGLDEFHSGWIGLVRSQADAGSTHVTFRSKMCCRCWSERSRSPKLPPERLAQRARVFRTPNRLHRDCLDAPYSDRHGQPQ